jgi:hypothetical protein
MVFSILNIEVCLVGIVVCMYLSEIESYHMGLSIIYEKNIFKKLFYFDGNCYDIRWQFPGGWGQVAQRSQAVVYVLAPPAVVHRATDDHHGHRRRMWCLDWTSVCEVVIIELPLLYQQAAIWRYCTKPFQK